MEYKNYSDDKVIVNIPKTKGKTGNLWISVNGVDIEIPRGIDTLVEKKYLEVIERYLRAEQKEEESIESIKKKERERIGAASQKDVEQLSREIMNQEAELNELKSMLGENVTYEEQVTSYNKFDNVFDETGKLDPENGGNLSASTLHRTKDLRDLGQVFTGNIYVALSKPLSSGNVNVSYYDENETFLTYEYLTGGEIVYTSKVIENVRFFRVHAPISYDGLICVGMNSVGGYENVDFSYKKETVAVGSELAINAPKKLQGRVVVNFGDSIFGKRRPPADISTKLAELTGATVHNCGFGGCHMSNHWATTYNAFSMCNLADAIVSGDWTSQDSAVADTTSNAVPSYFAEELEILKGLDFNKVDIITIAYGTNDFTAEDELENANDPYDIESYSGALRYSIEKLLTTYPHLKIFICSQTYRFWMDSSNVFTEDSDTKVNSKGVKLTDFVEKTKEIAKEYKLPFIDNYYSLGFNKFNRSHYFSATDGTHPLTEGCHLIAEHMANEMF